MWLIELFATGGFGTVVGLVGSYLTKREERLTAKVELDGQREMAELRLREMDKEQSHELDMADKTTQRAEVEGGLKIDQVEAMAFVESVKGSSNKTVGIKFVDGVRGLMRPLITVYLLVIATILAYRLNALVGGLGGLDAAKTFALYEEVIQQIIFLTATAVTWWFGSRPTAKKG